MHVCIYICIYIYIYIHTYIHTQRTALGPPGGGGVATKMAVISLVYIYIYIYIHVHAYLFYVFIVPPESLFPKMAGIRQKPVCERLVSKLAACERLAECSSNSTVYDLELDDIVPLSCSRIYQPLPP